MAIAASSTLVLVSLLLFAVNLFRNSGRDRFADHPGEVHVRMQVPGALERR